MALLSIFKKKKKTEPSRKSEKINKAEKAEKTVPALSKKSPPQKSKVLTVRPAGGRKVLGLAYKILKKPHISEKASDLNLKNQYIFEVFPASNKNQIKKAVEDIYGVDVVRVRIINIPRKKRRLGRTEGWKQGRKKAIIKINEGQKIEVLPR